MATARMKIRDPFIGGLPKLDTTRGLLSNQNTPRMSNTSSLGRVTDNLKVKGPEHLLNLILCCAEFKMKKKNLNEIIFKRVNFSRWLFCFWL